MQFTYTEKPSEGIVQIPLALLRHHPDNPRKDLGDLTELAASIKAKGVMQNLTVVPYRDIGGTGSYYVVIGNRRMEAAKQAGLETLPCVIADMSKAEQVQTMLLENMQRVDLTVYEQAAGFQMMMDFGDSVERISEKTGFSETTVRRRLKMAELDANTLKKVSDRQLSLADFDRLAEIEDVAVRNKVLEHIGTNNFDWHVAKAKEQQANRRRVDAVRQKLTEAGLTEITAAAMRERKDLTGVCGNVGSQFRVDVTSPDRIDAETYAGDGHCFYFDFEVWCYVVGPKTAAEEDEEDAFDVAEREREERYQALEEATERAYELRLDFIRSISEGEAKKHLPAAISLLAAVVSYHNFNGDLAEILELEDEEDEVAKERIRTTIEKYPCRTAVQLGYIAIFGLSGNNTTYTWRGIFTESRSLNRIYDYVRTLGYEPSAEELALLDGTHELYLKEDAE